MPAMTPEVIRRLPKTDLHVHLDGSLRLGTLIDLARERGVALPSYTEAGLRETRLPAAATRTWASTSRGSSTPSPCCRTTRRSSETTFELCEDCQAEGVRYVEIRFAPQLHVAARVRFLRRRCAPSTPGFGGPPPRSTPGRRWPRAGSRASPPGSSCARCARSRRTSPKATAGSSRRCPRRRRRKLHSAASVQVARAAARLKHDEGLLVVGIDLAGQEKGYPAEEHRVAYQVAHEAFLGKTVHAGEDYGPESIFQAIGNLHADRIGHGTWLFDESKIAARRITDRTRLRGAAGAVHRRQADHHRGLPDVEPADGPRAQRRPQPAPVRARCASGGCRRPSAPTTAWCRTPPCRTRSSARSRRSR